MSISSNIEYLNENFNPLLQLIDGVRGVRKVVGPPDFQPPMADFPPPPPDMGQLHISGEFLLLPQCLTGRVIIWEVSGVGDNRGF